MLRPDQYSGIFRIGDFGTGFADARAVAARSECNSSTLSAAAIWKLSSTVCTSIQCAPVCWTSSVRASSEPLIFSHLLQLPATYCRRILCLEDTRQSAKVLKQMAYSLLKELAKFPESIDPDWLKQVEEAED